jgi:hypothetical protein
MQRLSRFLPALVLAVAGAASAAEPAIQGPLCDPCVPPALRNVPPAPATEGAALQAQVERKLRASFEAADVQRTGALTRVQAEAAGLGVVAKNFDRIDTAKTGRVTFEDLKRYLRARGAKF